MENLRTASVAATFSSFLFLLGKQENMSIPTQERHADRRPSTAQDIRTSGCRASFSWAQVGARLIDVFARPVNRSSSSFWNLMACLDENAAAARRRISISAYYC